MGVLGNRAGVAIADNGPPPGLQAAADKCQAQGISDQSAMAKCVIDLLKAKVPAKVGTAPGGAERGSRVAATPSWRA